MIVIMICSIIGVFIGISLTMCQDKPSGVFNDPIPTYDDSEMMLTCYTDIVATLNTTENI